MEKKITNDRVMLDGLSMHIIASVKIKGCTDVNNLKTAINYSVNRFESLRSRVERKSDGQAYFIYNGEKVNPSIEVRNYHTDLQTLTNEQSKTPFRFDKGEMIRFIIEDLDGYMNIRMIEHHLGGDGKSVLMLFDEIIKNLDAIENGTFENEDKPVFPHNVVTQKYIENNIPLPDSLKNTLVSFNEMWKQNNTIFTNEDYLNIFDKYWSKNTKSVKTLKVDQKEMTKLVSISKKYKVSINSILMTTAAKVFARNEKLTVVADGLPEMREGMGNYSGGFGVDTFYDETKTFWENATSIHKTVHAILQDKNNIIFSWAMNNLLDASLYDAICFESTGCYKNEIAAKYNAIFSPKRHPFLISNIGRATFSETSKVKVEEMEVSSPMQTNFDCSLCVITVNGIMNIVMEYNKDAAFDYESMLKNIEDQIKHLA